MKKQIPSSANIINANANDDNTDAILQLNFLKFICNLLKNINSLQQLNNYNMNIHYITLYVKNTAYYVIFPNIIIYLAQILCYPY